jgi:hypothetical protein
LNLSTLEGDAMRKIAKENLQITGIENWPRVETSSGTEYVPSGWIAVFVPLTVNERAKYEGMIRPYVEGTIQEWENIKGYGARLSAPGYLDCTEWAVFDTEQEAREYLEEMYGDDDAGGKRGRYDIQKKMPALS